MKKIFAALASVIALSAMAQSSDWRLTPVPGANQEIVGYIYQTGAQGTQGGTKVKTYLRLICSTRPNSEPVIALFWETMIGNIPQLLDIKVDGRQVGVGQETRWVQDGPLLVRSIDESRTLLQSMKTGSRISFQWTGTDRVTRTTIFDLRDFRSDLSEFNTSCKTQI